MSDFTQPVPLLAATAAVLWPLAAGVTVVLWTQARAAERRRRLVAINGALKGMFSALEAQPIPERLEFVVDTLADQDEIAQKLAADSRSRRKTPAA